MMNDRQFFSAQCWVFCADGGLYVYDTGFTPGWHLVL